MKKFLLLLIAWVSLASCGESQRVEIEMLQLNGEWADVITVHGFYDNSEVASDIITGLQAVSRADGSAGREYRTRTRHW